MELLSSFLNIQPEADVIKLFCPRLTDFPTKLERLLEQAGKACRGQTLKLITKIHKLRTKKVL
jgi:hypothetical protein